MHVYQMRSTNKSIVAATEQRLSICMTALKDVSRVWLVAKMVHTLFESILGNKVLEERLQRAAGKRHQKNRPQNMAQPPMHPAMPKANDMKRKFDDIDINFSTGPPAPQVSYERSRPQTPAVTPSRDLHPPQVPTMTAQSPDVTRHNKDAFMGPSRSGTRPGSPFNPSLSYPGTPPDLFLVTRETPGLSQDIWQNFQPDQLFPADTNLSFPNMSPTQQHSLVDPQLSRQMPMHTPNAGMQQHASPVGSGQPLNTNGAMPMPHSTPQSDPNVWTHIDLMSQQQPRSDETWSNSSQGQPIAPTTLNVEDWYVFLSSQQYPQGFNPTSAASASMQSMGF